MFLWLHALSILSYIEYDFFFLGVVVARTLNDVLYKQLDNELLFLIKIFFQIFVKRGFIFFLIFFHKHLRHLLILISTNGKKFSYENI